jgi:hypothetical protein
MAVERLHRGVDIKNPPLREQRPYAIIEMPLQPLRAGRLVDLRQRPSQRIPRLREGRLSLTTLLMPSSGGLTAAQRNAVTCA